jgi:hypothetical protein
MNPGKLGDLINYNMNVAADLVLCLTHTCQLNEYLDALRNVKTTAYSLEVFARISGGMELPQDYISIYLSERMEECRN